MKQKFLFTAISLSIALLFWFTDSLILYIGLGEQSFEVIPSDFHELWKRSIIVVLIMAFGVFADYRNRRENNDVYRAMLNATHHILRNHLQNMLLFREEAEKSNDFDKEVLNEYDQMIDKTVAAIRNLENIQDPSRTNIEDRYLPN